MVGQQFYIGTKKVEAYFEMKDGKEGYVVIYPDGYKSWSPKDTFEKAYLPMGDKSANNSIGIALNSNTITQQMVDDFISEYEGLTLPPKTTVVKATLKNGFVIVEASSCVDEKNYDEEVGKQICVERIKDKVWELLGFLLQTAENGVK